MIIGALITMAFFFAYTAVRSASQNLGFNCAISFCLNIYYGTLYAYTPEVLPSAHRGTGNGVAIALNRVMGIMSAVVATFADVSTRPLIFDQFVEVLVTLTRNSTDEYAGAYLHLRCALSSHGHCRRYLPLRALWISKFLGLGRCSSVIKEAAIWLSLLMIWSS